MEDFFLSKRKAELPNLKQTFEENESRDETIFIQISTDIDIYGT